MLRLGRLWLWSTAGVSRTGKNPGRARRETAPAAGTKSLELQATLAGGVGQGLDAAVVAVTGTVERDLLDTGGLGLLGDRLADLGGGVGVLAVLQAFLHVGLHGRGGSQDLRAVRGEYLGVQ